MALQFHQGEVGQCVEQAIEDEEAWLQHDGARPGDPYLLDWRLIGFRFVDGSFLPALPPQDYRDLGHFLSMLGYIIVGPHIVLHIGESRTRLQLEVKPLRQAVGG